MSTLFSTTFLVFNGSSIWKIKIFFKKVSKFKAKSHKKSPNLGAIYFVSLFDYEVPIKKLARLKKCRSTKNTFWQKVSLAEDFCCYRFWVVLESCLPLVFASEQRSPWRCTRFLSQSKFLKHFWCYGSSSAVTYSTHRVNSQKCATVTPPFTSIFLLDLLLVLLVLLVLLLVSFCMLCNHEV